MKTKPTLTILVCVLAAGMAAGQSPITVIQNTRTTMSGVQSNSAAASNAALGIQDKAPSAATATHAPAKPSGAPVVSVKPSEKKASPATAAKTAKAEGAASKSGAAGKNKTPVAKTAKKSVPAKAVEAAQKNDTPAATTAAGSASPTAADTAASDDAPSKWNANGKRDPFISPVVSRAANISCSAGKKCLEIGTISLRVIVHAESGFIAVVSNGLNKAYFLRENDPVFNGYVMKITGDSITFQETLQDRLGKTFTREVVKKITTPAV
jgi:hypothetical protein